LNILAIDTASELFSTGLSTDAGCFYFEADAGAVHSELLFDAVNSLTKLAKIEREDIDLFACMKGPGSFTGLRIGFAAVKGLALALGKRILTAPTLDCIAYPFATYPFLCVPVLDAKQRRFFTALYRNGRRLTDYLDCTADELARRISENLNTGLVQEPYGSLPSRSKCGAKCGAFCRFLSGVVQKLQFLNNSTVETGSPPSLQQTVLLCGNAAALARDSLSPILTNTSILAENLHIGGSAALLQYIKKSVMLDTKENTRLSAPMYIRKSDAEIKRATAP
jgi:tRNA threonylcarbamoyl adenosine modification protein YeaZ